MKISLRHITPLSVYRCGTSFGLVYTHNDSGARCSSLVPRHVAVRVYSRLTGLRTSPGHKGGPVLWIYTLHSTGGHKAIYHPQAGALSVKTPAAARAVYPIAEFFGLRLTFTNTFA